MYKYHLKFLLTNYSSKIEPFKKSENINQNFEYRNEALPLYLCLKHFVFISHDLWWHMGIIIFSLMQKNSMTKGIIPKWTLITCVHISTFEISNYLLLPIVFSTNRKWHHTENRWFSIFFLKWPKKPKKKDVLQHSGEHLFLFSLVSKD